MARAALRVMVVQRVRISSVLGLGGTLGATEEDPALSELVLEPRRSEWLRLGLLLLTLDWCEAAGRPVRFLRCASTFKLEDESLPEEKLEKLDSVLVLLMLRARLSEVAASRSAWTGRTVWDQVSERISRDRAFWRRPGRFASPLDTPADPRGELLSSLMPGE